MESTLAKQETVEKLYSAYQADVRAFLRSKEREDASLIDDLVQDTFLKLWSSLAADKEIRNPKAWLMRVAHNLLIDHYRKIKKQTLLDDLESHPINDDLQINDADDHGPEDCLAGLISNLPQKYKQAVYLVDVLGVRQVDAADQLDLPLATFKSQVQRGRKMIKAGYMDCCDYVEDEKGYLRGEVKNRADCLVCN